QVYFHPVIRSAEVILTKIFDRASVLYKEGYTFEVEPTLLISLFEECVSVEDYLQLDESVINYYFQRWKRESDPILRDLCVRFVDRHLFKYVEFDPVNSKETFEQLVHLFEEAGINPTYYLVIDSSADLPYDVYRADGEGRVPIHLQMGSGKLKELSTHSVIVDSITGKTRQDHKLYYPEDKIAQIKDKSLREKINACLTVG